MSFEQRPHHPELLTIIFGVLLVVLVSLFLVAGEGSAKTLYVDDDAEEGGDGSLERPFRGIQDAINASEDGDTVRVWEGVYYEQVIVNKTISLIGNVSAETVINGKADKHTVTIHADWVNMSSFVLRGKENSSSYSSPWPWFTDHDPAIGGIYLRADHCSLSDNHITENQVGILLENASGNIIKGNTCINNTAAGICLYDSCDLNRLEDNNCSDNVVYGIRLWNSSNNCVENNACSNVFRNESSRRISWGIIVQDFSHSNFIGNNSCHLARDAGIFITRWSQFNHVYGNKCFYGENRGIRLYYACNNTILENNSCHFNGVGIDSRTFSSYRDPHFNEIRIEGNNCSYNRNQGIRASKIKNSSFEDNVCLGNGESGIRISGNTTNITIKNNRCLFNNGGIWFTGSNSTLQGNICLNNSYSGITVITDTNNVVSDNTCTGNDAYGITDDFSYTRLESYSYLSPGSQLMNNICSYNNLSGILLRSNNNSLIGNELSYNYNGIWLKGSSNNTLENNRIHSNVIGINLSAYVSQKIQYTSKNNTITNNSIYGNSVLGVSTENNEGHYVNASENWWGDESGPFHPELNPRGKGDNVTDTVEFSNWLNEDGSIHDPTLSEEETSDSLPFDSLLVVGSLAAILTIAFYLSEPFRFALFHLLAPFYTRLSPDRIEKDIKQQKVRGRIYQYIEDNPGINFSSVRKEVKVGTGTAVYHLSVLLRERYLRSSNSGNRKLFWTKRDFPGIEDSTLTEIHWKILETLEKSGTLSRAEIREKTGISKSTLGFNIKQLVEIGKVEEETRGKENYCSLKLY